MPRVPGGTCHRFCCPAKPSVSTRNPGASFAANPNLIAASAKDAIEHFVTTAGAYYQVCLSQRRRR